jgi:hypothetical protein
MSITQFSGNSIPGAGQLIAIYGGSPAATIILDGALLHAQVVETFGNLPATPPGTARQGDPLIADGVTIWLHGAFPAQPSGVPTADTRANILATWDAIRNQLLTPDYELFLHYDPGAAPLYRKYQQLNTAVLRAHWADPLGLVYLLGAVTTNRTLYTSAAGAS